MEGKMDFVGFTPGAVYGKQFWVVAQHRPGEGVVYRVYGVDGYLSGKFDDVDEAKVHAHYKETGQMRAGWM